MTKTRFILVVPYLIVTSFLLGRAYLFPDYSSFLLGVSDLLILLLLTPWIFLFGALINYFVLEGNLIAHVATVLSVAINAVALYYLGWKFERAPN